MSKLEITCPKCKREAPIDSGGLIQHHEGWSTDHVIVDGKWRVLVVKWPCDGFGATVTIHGLRVLGSHVGRPCQHVDNWGSAVTDDGVCLLCSENVRSPE